MEVVFAPRLALNLAPAENSVGGGAQGGGRVGGGGPGSDPELQQGGGGPLTHSCLCVCARKGRHGELFGGRGAERGGPTFPAALG